MSLIWERQPKETGQAWEAWLKYREMEPADRRYADIAKSLGKSRAMICKWGSHWKWESRIIAWDNHLDKITQVELEKEMRGMVKKHLEHAGLVLDIAISEVQRLHDRAEAGEDLELTPKEILTFMDWGVKLERLCYESPTELIEGGVIHQVMRKVQYINVREQRRGDDGGPAPNSNSEVHLEIRSP